jgi:hypothetical protein
MSWQSDWFGAFGIFTRPITFRRGDEVVEIRAFARALKTEEQVGDFDATTMMVVISALSLQQINLFPPQVYDRVDLGDGIDRNVQSFKIEYAQNVPMWCKLVVAG